MAHHRNGIMAEKLTTMVQLILKALLRRKSTRIWNRETNEWADG